MPLVSPIAAAAPGWLAAGLIDVIGPLLVVAFWVIRQVVVSLKEQRELDKARKEAEERGEQWPPAEEAAKVDDAAVVENPAGIPARPPAPAAKPAQVDLRSEVEEFLRRAAQGNAAPAPQPTKKPPLDPFDEPPRRKRPKPAVPQSKAPSKTANEPSNFDVPRNFDVQIEAPVRRVALRHLPESQLAENAAQLGANIASADDRVEARLHEKFDHRLGNLMSRPGGAEPTAVEPTSAAGRIRKQLAAPGGARQAVILSEILRSPVDRF
jgi:hypothetical protein